MAANPSLANLAFDVRWDTCLIVLRLGPGAPSPREWDRFLEACAPMAGSLEQMRVLVVTDGGRPQREQHARLLAMAQGRMVRTAVVSSHMAVRFVIAMVALVNPGVRGFASPRLDDALEYLGLSPAERAIASALVDRLSRVLAGVGDRRSRSSLTT